MVIRRQRVIPVYTYNCMIMAVVYLIVYTNPTKAHSQVAFDCHGDSCTRGVHYCAEDVGRCEFCREKRHECETSTLPRDCDGFCRKLEVEALKDQLTRIQENSQRLHQDNEYLNGILQEANKTIENLEVEQNRLYQLVINLNTTVSSDAHNKVNMEIEINRTKLQLQVCNDGKRHITLSLGISVGVFVIVGVFFVLVLWRKSTCPYPIKLSRGDKKEKESLVSGDLESLSTTEEEKQAQGSKRPVEEAGNYSQDARLTNVPPSSPHGNSKQVYNN